MSDLLFIIGLGVFVIGGIGFLIAAFRTSLLWGLGCLFLSPLQIIYLFTHWNSAKRAFFIQLVGGAIMLMSVWLQGNIGI